jgi:hypothetical protein
MPFDYYQRLSARDQAIYRASDAIHAVRLPRPYELHGLVGELADALARDDRAAVEACAGALTDEITGQLQVEDIRVEVLAVRPELPDAELHGLYTNDGEHGAHIRLWMRTAKKRRVVAWKTFLRTLLHEIGHHLDLTLLSLEDSFHTEGFFKRESSLFHQLVKLETPDAEG